MSIRIMLPQKQFQAIYVLIIDGNAIQILDIPYVITEHTVIPVSIFLLTSRLTN